MWHLPFKITEIPTCTTLNQGWVLDFRARVKIAESFPKILYNLWYVTCTIYGLLVLTKGSLSLYLFTLHQNGAYILNRLHKHFTCWKQFKYFILPGNLLLRESSFDIVNCLKLFNCTLFFIYTLKLLKGPGLWRLFLLYFEKQMTFSRACGSRVVHQLLNKTMQKLSAKVSKRGPTTSLKKGGSEMTALFAFPNIHSCSQLHAKKRTGFNL